MLDNLKAWDESKSWIDDYMYAGFKLQPWREDQLAEQWEGLVAGKKYNHFKVHKEYHLNDI